MMKARCVCVEGNVGAGKSSALESLALRGLTVRQEPVERWRPLLHEAYNRKRGLVALQARITLDTGRTPIEQVVERDPAFQVPVFMRAAVQEGAVTIAELNVLMSLHARVVGWRPSALVYLRCAPETCLRRVHARGRPEEAGITLAALVRLHDLYEQAYAAAPEPKHVLDVTDLPPDLVALKLEVLVRSARAEF